MKWKAVVKGDKPSEETVRILSECTGQFLDKTLLAFSHEEEIVCNGLSEGEAQKIADNLRRDPGVRCRILPDSEKEVQCTALFRVLLVNYRPGYRTRLRRRLQELTHLPQEQIVLWLSRMPFILSKGIDSETAKRIKKSVTEAGGIVRIETESLLQDNISLSRRSNAVFRTHDTQANANDTTYSDKSSGDVLITEQKDAAEDNDFLIPPVSGLPKKYTVGAPPLDEFENSYGRVVMHPPARYAVGLPSKSLDRGFLETPPVLPDISSSSIPEAIEFSPPEIVSGDLPPLVGSEDQDSSAIGPFPDIVIPYPPLSSISQNLLLPPVIGVSYTDLFTEENDILGVSDKDIGLRSERYISVDETRRWPSDKNHESHVSGVAVLKLFLCPPAPDDEDKVAEALRDVIGVSLRESWDLLRKPPALIEACVDHKRAIKIVHELESRGVTVSLTRGSISTGITRAGTGEGFQAWLKNG
jgi:ribosomal protein L7/L12